MFCTACTKDNHRDLLDKGIRDLSRLSSNITVMILEQPLKMVRHFVSVSVIIIQISGREKPEREWG